MSRSPTSVAMAWIVAASIAAVEALKEEGICRWNYALRSLCQHARSNISKPCSQATAKPSASSGIGTDVVQAHWGTQRLEESHRKVTELCWCPWMTRF